MNALTVVPEMVFVLSLCQFAVAIDPTEETIRYKAKINLGSDPGTVTPGITENLTLECSALGSIYLNGEDRTELVALSIFHQTPDTDQLLELATTNATGTSITEFAPPTTTVSAYINSTHGSNLKLSIGMPTKTETGSYVCQARAMDKFSYEDTYTSRLSVGHEAAAADQLLERVFSLKKQLDPLEKAVSVVTDSIFVRSGQLNGQQYLLSKVKYTDLDMAQAMCQLVDGYLVEFLNKSEYDNVFAFLNSSDVRPLFEDDVLIGLSDEAQEGTWMYLHSGGPHSYAPWNHEGNGEPDDGRKHNCAVLRMSTGYYFDAPCDGGIQDSVFLCQTPFLGNVMSSS